MHAEHTNKQQHVYSLFIHKLTQIVQNPMKYSLPAPELMIQENEAKVEELQKRVIDLSSQQQPTTALAGFGVSESPSLR